MYCSSCGSENVSQAMRCDKCHKYSAWFWYNAYAAFLLLTTILVNGWLMMFAVPQVAERYAASGQMMPLSLRTLSDGNYFIITALPWIVGILIILGIVMWRTKAPVPRLLKNGLILSVVAWITTSGFLFLVVRACRHVAPIIGHN